MVQRAGLLFLVVALASGCLDSSKVGRAVCYGPTGDIIYEENHEKFSYSAGIWIFGKDDSPVQYATNAICKVIEKHQ